MINVSKDKNDISTKDFTTRIIALVLLYTFIGSVLVLFLTNIFGEYLFKKDTTGEMRKGWFELLKNALILLGTALTTIIGYYFGQREGAIKAQQAERDIQETDKQAQQAIEKVVQQRDVDIRAANPKESDSLFSSSPTLNEGSDILPPQ